MTIESEQEYQEGKRQRSPGIEVLLEGFPIESEEGFIGFCSVTLVRGADADGKERLVVVDAAHVGRRPLLMRALERAGVKPGDVDYVVLTHSHWDHVQNLDLFSRAEVVIHQKELRYARQPRPEDWATPGWTGSVLDCRPVRAVEDGEELLSGVKVMDAFGHSPGSMAVAVETEAGLSVITGDAVANGRAAAEGRTPMVFYDVKQADATVEKLLSVADVVYPGHDQPFRMVSGGVEYVRPFKFTLTGVRGDEQGLALVKPREFVQYVLPGLDRG